MTAAERASRVMRRHLAPGLAVAYALWCAAMTPAWAARQAASGIVEGRVVFEGQPPAPAVIEEGGGSQPVLYVDPAGGLRYAVVYLPDARATVLTRRPATMNQRNFVFEPQVLAVRAGQVVRFTNDDPANHNVRARGSNPANTFSINTAAGSGGPATHTFASTAPDDPVRLSCDIHPWMAAWIYVLTHDQFAVTKADGSFRINGVPAGRHRLAVRQPAGRLARDLAIEVRPGGTAHVEIRFTPADLGMPAR